MSRRLTIIAIVLVLALAAVWAFAQTQRPSQPTASDQQMVVDDDLTITVSATLSPERYAFLALRSVGRVERVHVTAGQAVAAGDVLVLALAVGAAGAMYPAWHAASRPPIEALNYE